jgi:hypothetical protein
MEISPFLSEIARGYNGAIEYVGFEDLSRVPRKPFGVTWARKDREWYAIEIDRDRLPCPFQVFFVFFHELGHIVYYHLGYRFFTGNASLQEREADSWAFSRMGMIDDQGRIKEENRLCYDCIRGSSRVCLKDLVT